MTAQEKKEKRKKRYLKNEKNYDKVLEVCSKCGYPTEYKTRKKIKCDFCGELLSGEKK